MAIWTTAVGFGKCDHHADYRVNGTTRNSDGIADYHVIAYGNGRFPHRNTPTNKYTIADHNPIAHADGTTDNATNGRY